MTESISADSSAFSALGLSRPLVRAVIEEGYAVPTPVQSGVVPEALKGRDVVACAQTGTGKTAAFVLPVLQRLGAEKSQGRIRALILTPTRELAAQIASRIVAYGRHLGLKHALIYGGVGQRPQERALAAKPDIVIACPGRLLDLMKQGFVDLSGVSHLVLDEADRMLDMGFIHDVQRIVDRTPKARQTLLLSATLPRSVQSLIATMLKDPHHVSVRPEQSTADNIEQSVVFVAKADKRDLLHDILGGTEVERALVFTRTKHGANRVARDLERVGIVAAAIHGNKSQSARDRALASFRAGSTRVLVATDVAARGIDVEGISHVINYDLPNVAESYVHRIGRTGRAGESGRAISFCDGDERRLLGDIERLIRCRITVDKLERRPAAPRREQPVEPTVARPAEHIRTRPSETSRRPARPASRSRRRRSWQGA